MERKLSASEQRSLEEAFTLEDDPENSDVNLTGLNSFLRIKAIQKKIQSCGEDELLEKNKKKEIITYKIGQADHKVEHRPTLQLGNLHYENLRSYDEIRNDLKDPRTLLPEQLVEKNCQPGRIPVQVQNSLMYAIVSRLVKVTKK